MGNYEPSYVVKNSVVNKEDTYKNYAVEICETNM